MKNQKLSKTLISTQQLERKLRLVTWREPVPPLLLIHVTCLSEVGGPQLKGQYGFKEPGKNQNQPPAPRPTAPESLPGHLCCGWWVPVCTSGPEPSLSNIMHTFLFVPYFLFDSSSLIMKYNLFPPPGLMSQNKKNVLLLLFIQARIEPT